MADLIQSTDSRYQRHSTWRKGLLRKEPHTLKTHPTAQPGARPTSEFRVASSYHTLISFKLIENRVTHYCAQLQTSQELSSIFQTNSYTSIRNIEELEDATNKLTGILTETANSAIPTARPGLRRLPGGKRRSQKML